MISSSVFQSCVGSKMVSTKLTSGKVKGGGHSKNKYRYKYKLQIQIQNTNTKYKNKYKYKIQNIKYKYLIIYAKCFSERGSGHRPDLSAPDL